MASNCWQHWATWGLLAAIFCNSGSLAHNPCGGAGSAGSVAAAGGAAAGGSWAITKAGESSNINASAYLDIVIVIVILLFAGWSIGTERERRVRPKQRE